MNKKIGCRADAVYGLLLRLDMPKSSFIPCTERQMPVVIRRLKDHLVWPVGAAEAEAGAKVVGEVRLLLDGGKKRLIDRLLVLNAVLCSLLLLSQLLVHCQGQVTWSTYLGLLALLEERVLTRLVGGLVLGEVTVLADLVQNLRVDALQVDRGRGSDDISGVYPSQRNAVDFEGSGDKEDTLGEVLEEDNTLAAETTSEEDDDGAGLEGCPRFRRTDSLASLESQLAELSMLRSRPFFHHHFCIAAAVVLQTCNCPPSRPPLPGASVVRYRVGEHTFLGTATSSAG
jgi:hypothetical protein